MKSIAADASAETLPLEQISDAVGVPVTTYYDANDPNTYKKGNHIYLADFANQRIETYDNQWKDVSGEFAFARPAGVPELYSPWNIQYVGDKLYVEYVPVMTLGIEAHGPCGAR